MIELVKIWILTCHVVAHVIFMLFDSMQVPSNLIIPKTYGKIR